MHEFLQINPGISIDICGSNLGISPNRNSIMKTIIFGDIHGRSVEWKHVVNNETFDRIVFIGDYFDSFDIGVEKQVNNFLDIIEYKKTTDKEVIMLIGNHDHHYFVGDTGTSGFQQVGKYQIIPVLKDNSPHLQMAYRFDNILCTHAGVSETFMNDCLGEDGWKIDTIADDMNELWKHKADSFIFNGYNPYGDDIGQTPIWIRPISLIKDSKNIMDAGIIQVVGHTEQSRIRNVRGKYYFIDAIAIAKEYLIVEQGNISTGKI